MLNPAKGGEVHGAGGEKHGGLSFRASDKTIRETMYQTTQQKREKKKKEKKA